MNKTISMSKAPSTQKIFVAIAGNIGTGKTTLTQMISDRFGWQPHYEAVANNPYLTDFYQDMSRWAFSLQIYFLNSRFKTHQVISNGTVSSIQDRCIYEDANIFARNLYDQKVMSERDYLNYLELYETMCSYLTPPDLMIYLKKSVPRLQKQIQIRGRDFEKEIPESYLSSLNRYYDEWIDGYQHGKKLVVESDDLDFVRNPEDFELVAQKIKESIDQLELFGLTTPAGKKSKKKTLTIL